MFSSLKSFAHYFGTYPLRGVLTILTVALGVAALTITFSLSFDVTNALNETLWSDGLRIVVKNGEVREDGSLNLQLPPVFREDTPDLLESEYENLRSATTVAEGRWFDVATEDASYQIRSSLAVEADYETVMGLSIVAGSFISDDDVERQNRVVAMSEEAATMMFGSANAAVGQTITGSVPVAQAGSNRPVIGEEAFRVVGVFATPEDLERELYGIGDVLIPLGVSTRPGFDAAIDPTAYVVARLVNDSLEAAEARIRATLEVEYGEDTLIGVWEGNGARPESVIEQVRRAASSFVLTINVLGVIILIASSIGVFSVMLVEVLGRMREIGLRRAMGASKWQIRRFFTGQALYYTLIGGIVGTALAFLFYPVIGQSMLPFFEQSGISASMINLTSPGALPIALSLGAAVIIGTLFGFFPAISASRTPIVEAIREDAA